MHVVGWSLGGIFSLLAAADRRDLPIASVTVVGSPVDVTQVPLVAPLRPLLNFTDGRLLTPLYQLLGGAPKPLVKWAFQLSSFQKLITKPLAVATHLDDADFLAQIEAVDRFTANMIAYPGRSFGQLYHRFVRSNALSTGRFELGDRTIDAGGDHRTGAGLRRRHRRHRAGRRGQGRRSPAHRRGRGALRDRPGRPPRDADRPGCPRLDLAGARRVGRPVVDRRRAGADRQEDRKEEVGEEDRRQEARDEAARPKKSAAKTAATRKPSPDPDAIGVEPDPSLRLGELAQPGPLKPASSVVLP